MTHASLFTGIGGFDLAALWMGWKNVFQCEIDPFCVKLLKQNFPNTIKYGNIKETSFGEHRGTIDILSGGFPCQPYSIAGKRLGKEDERHLWPQMLRAIREIQPVWVVGENVRGLTNWNGGLVFDEVQSDLESEGYEVLPFLLPAASVSAPHQRERVFIIAYANGEGFQRRIRGEQPSISKKEKSFQRSSALGIYPENEWWKNFPTQSSICRRDDGIPNRMDRVKALGNAVVPQVVLQIFKAIGQYEKA